MRYPPGSHLRSPDRVASGFDSLATLLAAHGTGRPADFWAQANSGD